MLSGNEKFVGDQKKFMDAVVNEEVKTVKNLLKDKSKNIDINLQFFLKKNNGITALYYAAEMGYVDIVKLLLKAGADPNIKKRNTTPLDIAVHKNHLEVSALLDGSEQSIHSCIIQRMQALGFQPVASGICYGYAAVAQHYALAKTNSLKQFYNNLFLLKRLKVKDLLQMEADHDHLSQKLYMQAEQESIETLGFQDKRLSEKEENILRETTNKKLHTLRKQLTKEQQEKEAQYFDILALLTAFELEFHGYKSRFSHLHAKHDLVLKSHLKDFVEKKPTAGELVVIPRENNSLRYKFMTADEKIIGNKISKEELKAELQEQYNEFTQAKDHKNIPKLNTFLPNIFNIIAKNGYYLPEKRLTTQAENHIWVTPLIQPESLEEKGGEAHLCMFTGAYKQEELPIYFKTLRMRLKENKNIKDPVMLQISASNHQIAIMYDPIDDQWINLDVNVAPSNPDELKKNIHHSEQEIAKAIIKGLASKKTHPIFETQVITTKIAEKNTKPAIDAWIKDLIPLHTVTPEKARCLDYRDVSWLWIAARAGDLKTVLSLISHNANVNAKDNAGFTALYVAAQRGHSKIVDTLLQHPGIRVNVQSDRGYTAFFTAAMCGRTDIVKLFFEKNLIRKFNLNLAIEDNTTPLVIAAQEGYTDIIKLLLNSNNIDFDSENNGTLALWLAAQNGHLDTVIELLKQKSQEIDPNQEHYKTTALYIAAQNGHFEIVSALLTANFKIKIDIDGKGTHGVSPLYAAAQNGHTSIVRALCEARAELNSQYKNFTPALEAAQNGHTEVIRILAEAKADLEFFNPDGVTPLIMAAKQKHLKVAQLLLATGKVNVNQTNVNGGTALHTAIKKNNIPFIQILLEHKNIDINIKDNVGYTPLCDASGCGFLSAVKLLLKSGKVNVNLEEKVGISSLFMAAQNGHTEIVKLLLDNGFNPDWARPLDGASPLYMAAKSGHFEVVTALLAAGANPNQMLFMEGNVPKAYPELEYPPSALEIAMKGDHQEVVKLLLSYYAKPFERNMMLDNVTTTPEINGTLQGLSIFKPINITPGDPKPDQTLTQRL